MIEFKRYPHVGELIKHYANTLNREEVTALLSSGVTSRDEAYILSRFVLTVIDRMALDMKENILVLGSKDNTSMIPDIDYEISLYLANNGMEDIWDKVCSEE